MAEASGRNKDSSSPELIWLLPSTNAVARLSVVLGLAVVYFVAGKLGLRFATIHPSATAIWAPTGIALAACLVFGRWVVPGIFVAAFLVNVTTAGSIVSSVGIAAGNTLEAVFGAYLIDRFARGVNVFERTQDVFRFLLLAAIVSTAMSATVGVTSLCLAGYARWSDYGSIWLTWWLGDASGDLIVAPLLLLWANNRAINWDRDHPREAIIFFVALAVTGGGVFGGWLPLPSQQYPLDFLCFPILLWAAFRFGPRETATASFFLSVVAIVGTLNGLGPFARDARDEALPLLQAFAALTGLMSIAVATAVAERRRLDETRAQLAAIVDSSDDAIIGLDMDRLITSWNLSATRIFGFSSAEAVGQPVTIILPSEELTNEKEVDTCFGRGDAVRHFETPHIREAGERIDLSLTISPIRGRGARIIGASIVARDITGEKRARRQREELLAAQQLAREAAEADNRAKDEFLAMLGHELRNPLHAISLATGLLGNSQIICGGAARAHQIIARQAEHLTRLVDDLLDVARVTSGRIVLNTRPVNLANCVSEWTNSFRETRQLDRHDVQVDAEPVWVDADSDRLAQVVTNLLGNALKYTPSGGKILISVTAQGANALMYVRDEGVGIPAAFLPHVFDLFARGEVAPDRASGGLGVGLTLVRRLVELHLGQVEAFSDGPGRGSVFVVRLPKIAAPAALESLRGNGTLEPSTRRRILVIEDNADVRESLRDLLQLSRHEVYEAADGPAGVETALSLRPEVALVDIGLPGLDGYQVARRLRANPDCDDMVLIALTGYALNEDRRRAEEAGFQGYLAKPVDPKRLMQLIAALSPRVSENSTNSGARRSA